MSGGNWRYPEKNPLIESLCRLFETAYEVLNLNRFDRAALLTEFQGIRIVRSVGNFVILDSRPEPIGHCPTSREKDRYISEMSRWEATIEYRRLEEFAKGILRKYSGDSGPR